MIRTASPEEIENWDQLVLENPDGGHIYQTQEWGRYKSDYGWKTHYLVWDQAGERVAVMAISKTANGFGNLWYIPKGPGMFKRYEPRPGDEKCFKTFSTELTKYVGQHDRKAFTIMIDPELIDKSFKPQLAGWTKSAYDLQFKATIIVDIDHPDEALLSNFKQKTRYNIRLASKKGVTVESREATAEMVDEMFGLMQATQGRAGFFLRPKRAFAGYWQALAEAGLGQFFVATYEGEILAAEYAFIFGDKAYYKEGGSSGRHRNLMAPYLLQYEVMRWARDRGAKEYDLIAVPPKDKLNPEHSMWGLYQFKSGFNEEITEFIGGWDYPLKKKVYQRWRKWAPWFHRIYHRVRGNLFW